MIVRNLTAADSPSRSSDHQSRPPSCLWREMWYRAVLPEDTLVMNASIYRNPGSLTGEFYLYWNGERLPQFDQRITDEPDKEKLKTRLIDAADVVLTRLGLAEKERIHR